MAGTLAPPPWPYHAAAARDIYQSGGNPERYVHVLESALSDSIRAHDRAIALIKSSLELLAASPGPTSVDLSILLSLAAGSKVEEAELERAADLLGGPL